MLPGDADTVCALLGEAALIDHQYGADRAAGGGGCQPLCGHRLDFPLNVNRVPTTAGQKPLHGHDVSLGELQRHRFDALAARGEEQPTKIMKGMVLTLDAPEMRGEAFMESDEILGACAQIFLDHDGVLLTTKPTTSRADPLALRNELLDLSAKALSMDQKMRRCRTTETSVWGRVSGSCRSRAVSRAWDFARG